MKKILLAFLLLPLYTFAQKDTSFWFAAPDIVEFLSGTPHDKPVLFRLTSFGTAANVTISIPANPSFTPVTATIAANSTISIDLSSWANLVENSAANTPANKGILIRSSADITAYYEVVSTCNCNPELFALKGKSALGNEFIISSQKEWPIDTVRFPTARSAFNIVATENNTSLTITPSQALVGRPAGMPFNIILNRGQSFSNQGLYRNGPSLLNGSIVVSDKPVSVTTTEDLLMADGPCADLAGDQLIPTAIWGDEFVVIRGALNNKDKAVITAATNGTAIYLNGATTPTATINRGQSYEFNLTSPTVYIKTSSKVAVYHYTGINCEIGSAVIPKINCTGSQDVAITRSINEDATVFIVTRQGLQSGFTVNGSAGIITAADFSVVPGSAGAYVFCKKDMGPYMTTGSATRFVNTTGKFSLGFLNGANPSFTSGCRYGYFSDFKSSNVTNSQRDICRLDSVQLNAFGGISYQWFPATGLSSTTIANPKASPPVTTDYKVIITTDEGCIDSAFVKVVVNSCTAVPVACNNWLRITAPDSYASVGDLDIPGQNVTVEAVFNRTAPYTGGYLYAGDLVSKHNFCDNVNYLLRPNSAEITTTNGYFIAATDCEIELNKTYHVAMTYDGATLKFYRNGFLMSQVPATGTLIQNNLNTQFGRVDFAPSSTTFVGYINEVRIWNVTRSQNDLQNYMATTLPTPLTQTGLRGYYTFDNLLNQQGNTAFNASLIGSATINNTIPVCTISTDSCGVLPSDSLIVNSYTPVLSFDICKNNIVVEDGSAFNTGDTVLIIQMKGAVIDSSNTAAFGTVTDYKNAGNYEFNFVKSRTGNTIELLHMLTRQYDVPAGKVQLIRVPYYHNVSFNKPLTCLPWDGNKGGVLVFNVRDTINLDHNIDVSGRGFRGGIDPAETTVANNYNCYENQFFYPPSPLLASGKGEGIAALSDAKSFGKGALANGGGGGNSHNSGGGGGGNAAAGGLGGYSFEGAPCNMTVPFDNRGIGGRTLLYSNIAQKIFLGGGGGAGQSNNPEGFQAKGGNGAGIIIITAGRLKSNGHKIIANGNSSAACGSSAMAICGNTQNQCHEGMGGGGAAGTVLSNIGGFIGNTTIETIGGKGGDMVSAGNLRVGPGGGGAGGVTWFSQNAIPANVSVNRTGGANGVCIAYANSPWGSIAGSLGISLFSLNLPAGSTPFKPNIDSVRYSTVPASCRAFNFNGFGYTNTHAVATWQWYFGDGNTANTQNTSHTYGAAGTYDVKLVITDINGCKDSITRQVNTSSVTAEAGNDASYCSNGTVTHTLNGTGAGTTFNWQPAIFLNDNTIANPIATITATTKFYLTKTDPLLGCSATDSVLITVNPVPLVSSFGDTAFCANTSLQLNAAGAATYAWSPAGVVNNPTIANPLFTGTSNQTMTVTGTNAEGCSVSSSFDVTVKALPTVTTIPDSTICNTQSIVLTTTGAATYSWSPPTNLSNPNIANPTFNGTSGGTYTVTGTAANGCSNTDVVVITTRTPGVFTTPPNAAVCINSSVTLNGNNGSGVTYAWSPANTLSNPASMNPVATPTTTGNNVYTVVISETVCNSSNTFNVNVMVNPLPNVDVSKSNDLDCSIRTSTLTGRGAAQYSWAPVATLSTATGTTTIASPTIDTKYIVTGTDANGCVNKDSIVVLVKGTDGRFDIPNSFTPNGDGKNDCFGVRHWGDAAGFRFMIFNRWGEKVFETNDLNQCWDGRYKGQPADMGGYVYYIKSVNLCGETVKKGNVLLIR